VKILLTGANGFVGSHVLDAVLAAGHEAAITLRRTSQTRFIERHLAGVQVHYAPLGDPQALDAAVGGAEVVLHCAAKTKAVRAREYFTVNAEGTRRLVEACNAHAGTVRQLVHISSLAVSGPGTPAQPAREEAPPAPVSAYGRSKAEGEEFVRTACRVPYTVLRPAAVYGPRDTDFFLLFKAVRSGVVPLVDGGRQPVSLAFARDVAAGVLAAVGREAGYGRVYHLAHPVPWTQRALLGRIARAMGVEPRRLPVPGPLLFAACLGRDLYARITGEASIMNLTKVPEYTAPGWVCATDAAREDLGFVPTTELDEGIRRTLGWYQDQGWL
jgi:nucleoside-diphosphate-sugar epimerase